MPRPDSSAGDTNFPVGVFHEFDSQLDTHFQDFLYCSFRRGKREQREEEKFQCNRRAASVLNPLLDNKLQGKYRGEPDRPLYRLRTRSELQEGYYVRQTNIQYLYE